MTEQQILTELQSTVRKHLLSYMREHKLRARHLSMELDISESYMSDILYNKHNFKLSTLIELGLKTGCKPVLSFQPVSTPQKNSITT